MVHDTWKVLAIRWSPRWLGKGKHLLKGWKEETPTTEPQLCAREHHGDPPHNRGLNLSICHRKALGYGQNHVGWESSIKATETKAPPSPGAPSSPPSDCPSCPQPQSRQSTGACSWGAGKPGLVKLTASQAKSQEMMKFQVRTKSQCHPCFLYSLILLPCVAGMQGNHPSQFVSSSFQWVLTAWEGIEAKLN